MHKFPFVVEYRLGLGQVEFGVAERLLAEYEDFYLYNQSQYRDLFRKFQIDEDENDPKLVELRRQKAEANSKLATDHWAKLFRSLDFAEVTLLGLQIDWDELQKILQEDFRTKVHPTDSSLNFIAPPLRRLCSVLLFADRLETQIGKIDHKFDIDEARTKLSEKINELLAKLESQQVFEIREFSKNKHQIQKLKNPDAIITYIKEL